MIYKVTVDDEYDCQEHIGFIEADNAYDAVMRHPRVDLAFDKRLSYDTASEIVDKGDLEYLIGALKYHGVFVDVEQQKNPKEYFITKLIELQEFKDFEAAHSMADSLLCEFLESIGHKDIVEEFNKVGKYYA